MADIISGLGVDLLEEEIDDVIFQTNEFLCDATFTGSQGPFWWIFLVKNGGKSESTVYQLLSRIFVTTPKFDGTKTGQKSDLSIQRAACPDALFISSLHPCAAKVLFCPVTNKETGNNPLLLSTEIIIMLGFCRMEDIQARPF